MGQISGVCGSEVAPKPGLINTISLFSFSFKLKNELN